ncbi:FHA domain-containing protein [Pseudanabaena sp. PCC 6802]|uniref:FHA domain-containing protein n=1 Tax=Pseudanabaena sp. PCC 6802 TaxID=118173 RepID=UPI0003482679|nr:FHA domain-containing protein [Pseudanabaena sp. PCC 6802]
MITCPSCSHQNPDNATQCEACLTPLPVVTTIDCPSCGTSVQSDASFCGHCGFDLRAISHHEEHASRAADDASTFAVDPAAFVPVTETVPPVKVAAMPEKTEVSNPSAANVSLSLETLPELPKAPINVKTQLQRISASLLHVQTNVTMELPTNLQVVHIGKPNNMIPPDIDVSGFPDSDIVSRVHGDIRYEGGAFYFEDTGSSNGTYINNIPLASGNRHRLRAGDRVSLGKGDKVSFIFQVSEG